MFILSSVTMYNYSYCSMILYMTNISIIYTSENKFDDTRLIGQIMGGLLAGHVTIKIKCYHHCYNYTLYL